MITPQDGADVSAETAELASEWCMRLADGDVTPGMRQELDAWLAADERNARAFADALRVWQSFGQAQSSDAMSALRRETLSRFEAAQREQRQRISRRNWIGAIAAGLTATVIGLGLWMRAAPASYVTAGQREVVTLEDGSVISMDAQTRVDVRYSEDRRELQLKQGRAKFSVAHDTSRPFSVMAANRLVVATGTQFSVELLAQQVHVILYEGSVDVVDKTEHARNAGASDSTIHKLVPGQELIAAARESSDAQVKRVDLASSLSWEAGQITFDDEALSTAVERMNRYASTPMSVVDDAAARMPISGTFFAGDTESFIEGVTSIFPVSVETVDGRQRFISTQ